MSNVVTQHDPLAEAQATVADLREKLEAAIAAAPPERILKWRRDFGDARMRAVSVFDDEGTPLDYVIGYAGPDDEWLLTFEGFPQTRGTLIECMDAAERSERASRDRLKGDAKPITA